MKSFCNICQICIDPQQWHLFNFVLSPPQVCILYTVWHKLCGNVCSEIVPVALLGRGFTVCFTSPVSPSCDCFKRELDGLCIFSFSTTQYQNLVDNSHMIFNSDHWLKKSFSPLHYQYKQVSFVLSQLELILKYKVSRLALDIKQIATSF